MIVLASFAGIAWGDAHAASSREWQEHRASEARSHAARGEAQERWGQRGYPARAQGVRAATRPEGFYGHEHPLATGRPPMAERAINAPRFAGGSVMHGTGPAGGARVHEVARGFAGGQLRVVRYGRTLSGTVERAIRPGFVSRTFVGGGHVLYAHVYQRHVWNQFGRAFAYETFVPTVRYPGAYYAWALAAWPHPLAYRWGWQVQAWYPMYGALFTPYAVYTSPDLWMTDYILAQSMQTAYQAQAAAPGPEPSGQGAAVAPDSDSSAAVPAEPPSDPASVPQSTDAPAPQPQPQASPPSAAPIALPPAITPEVKAQLDDEIKVQLQEHQAAAVTPVSLTTQSTPPALRPNHVFFQVVQPIEVPVGGNSTCSLSANDYIRRTGGMSQDDWMIPVVVELSRPSGCPQGLRTRISLNDLNAMENEQEAQVMEAMQAASKSMGPNGPPSGVQPSLIAAGNAGPDPSALDAIRQAQ